jgi:hypothetical protein
LGDPVNYVPADPMVTPAHIVPEWYFLPFYAILRAITFDVPLWIPGLGLLGLSLVLRYVDLARAARGDKIVWQPLQGQRACPVDTRATERPGLCSGCGIHVRHLYNTGGRQLWILGIALR